tara:strand:- start:537 stop:704 length:168 start_codon:yes stop_codon:yes gene_type:complete
MVWQDYERRAFSSIAELKQIEKTGGNAGFFVPSSQWFRATRALAGSIEQSFSSLF